jgi:diadenosine tetraphosphate (Ap4A) HIT family hydrolase
MLTFGTIRLLNFSRISEEVDEIHQHIYPRYQQTLQRQKRYKNWKQNENEFLDLGPCLPLFKIT